MNRPWYEMTFTVSNATEVGARNACSRSHRLELPYPIGETAPRPTSRRAQDAAAPVAILRREGIGAPRPYRDREALVVVRQFSLARAQRPHAEIHVRGVAMDDVHVGIDPDPGLRLSVTPGDGGADISDAVLKPLGSRRRGRAGDSEKH